MWQSQYYRSPIYDLSILSLCLQNKCLVVTSLWNHRYSIYYYIMFVKCFISISVSFEHYSSLVQTAKGVLGVGQPKLLEAFHPRRGLGNLDATGFDFKALEYHANTGPGVCQECYQQSPSPRLIEQKSCVYLSVFSHLSFPFHF